MKLFVCCLLLLPCADVVLTATIRAQRENVLSFLDDAFGAATEKAVPANITACRNPPSRPVKEPDSEDLSKSTEVFHTTDGFPEPGVPNKYKDDSRDVSKDRDSDEIPEAVGKEKPPLRTEGLSKDDNLSRDHVRQPASRDLTSEEGVMVRAKVAANRSGKRVFASDGVSPNFQAAAGRADRRKLALGRRGEMLDSVEDDTGRLIAAGSSKHTDYDETREYMSSEIYPIAPPEQRPCGSSVPAKS